MKPEQQRAILEAAAKACGVHLLWHERWGCFYDYNKRHESKDFQEWNPITNSSDTAEMCAKLGVNSEWDLVSDAVICDVNWDDTCTYPTVTSFFSNYANSRLKAWMYAATMCAAKIGGYTE